MRVRRAFIAVLFLASGGPVVHGAVITGNVADAIYSAPRTAGATFDAGTSGTGSVTLQNAGTSDTVLQVGGTSANASIASSVTVFQLPTLNPGESFSNVSFSIGQTTASNAQQVDLYGLGRRSTAATAASDYYRGTTNGDATDATLIQAAFVSTSDVFAINGITSTSAAGGAALADYLNAQYASGTGAGQFVFLRLNVTNVFSTANTRLNPASADNVTTTLVPAITYSVSVPEPASLSLLSLGGLMLLTRHRRKS